MMTVYRFSEEETQEVFDLMREQIRCNAHCNRGQKPWPLYDNLAKHYGKNDSVTEYEYWRSVIEDEEFSAREEKRLSDIRESEEE